MVDNAREDTIKLGLVLDPIPTDHGHAHCPETPTQERYSLELALGKIPAVSQHSGTPGHGLNQVEVGPGDMVGHDNSRLGIGQGVARYLNAGSVERLKDELNPCPDGEGQTGRGIVDPSRKEDGKRQKHRNPHVHQQQVQQPWHCDDEAPQEGPGRRVLGHGRRSVRHLMRQCPSVRCRRFA